MIWQSHGSSPLTRGKHVGFPRRPLGFGLIPTHAGKTTRPGGCLRERRAHPHSRGENTRTVTGSPPRRGSSPLTRGKHSDGHRVTSTSGLIPTHAGKTCAWRKREWTCWAHPHSRGENSEVSAGHAARAGSSPFTRGKRRRYRIRGPDSGLIPAHAGKTTNRGAHATGTQAHPRSRGENAHERKKQLVCSGSSPLTRGKRLRSRRREGQHGLIPAHAGKTARPRSDPYGARAHPRSRGEN